ncbi:hypothetical protein PABG_00623 [Paracoccidioides brasiliensis Pb03]|nr:hypothetical protein PABG_00623 [Paracoccidioides brasiliensis Pb03]
MLVTGTERGGAEDKARDVGEENTTLSRFCPGYTGTKIQVLNVDTFDAGIQELSNNSNPSSTTMTEPTPPAPVAVLNMASDFALGGE